MKLLGYLIESNENCWCAKAFDDENDGVGVEQVFQHRLTTCPMASSFARCWVARCVVQAVFGENGGDVHNSSVVG